jgi:hypothetical protein
MRRWVMPTMLALAVVASLAPLTEAAVACRQECPGEAADGGCSPDLCCSCCVHVRVDAPALARKAGPVPCVGRLAPGAASSVKPPYPREILHVPKP